VLVSPTYLETPVRVRRWAGIIAAVAAAVVVLTLILAPETMGVLIGGFVAVAALVTFYHADGRARGLAMGYRLGREDAASDIEHINTALMYGTDARAFRVREAARVARYGQSAMDDYYE
jgi:hypothetical protein